MKQMVVVLVLCSLWTLAQPASADSCGIDDSWKSCSEKVMGAKGTTAITESVARKNTGADSALLNGLGSKVDFNSLVRFLIDSGVIDGQQDEDSGAFSLDLTNFLGLDASHGYKVQLVTRQAEVFDGIEAAVEEQIPEAEREGRLKEIKEGLSEFSDATAIFSFSWNQRGLGRDPRTYSDDYSHLLEGALSQIEQQEAKTIRTQTKILELGRDFDLTTAKAKQLIDGDLTFRDAFAPSVNGATLFAAAVERYVRARLVESAAFDEVLESGRFLDFAKLIDNQPQLVFTGEQTFRDPVVGPDETKVRISYEYGFANVGRLNRFCRALHGDYTASEYFECLGEYLKGGQFASGEGAERKEEVAPGAERINAGHRLSFSAEYSEVDDYDFDPGEGIDRILKKGDHTVMVSLGYSRYLNVVKTADTSTRLDVSWSYEDSGSDKTRNDRHIGQALLTIPTVNGMFLAAGLKYSSDPKFRGDVDKELSARLGLTFKFLPAKDEDEKKDGDG